MNSGSRRGNEAERTGWEAATFHLRSRMEFGDLHRRLRMDYKVIDTAACGAVLRARRPPSSQPAARGGRAYHVRCSVSHGLGKSSATSLGSRAPGAFRRPRGSHREKSGKQLMAVMPGGQRAAHAIPNCRNERSQAKIDGGPILVRARHDIIHFFGAELGQNRFLRQRGRAGVKEFSACNRSSARA